MYGCTHHRRCRGGCGRGSCPYTRARVRGPAGGRAVCGPRRALGASRSIANPSSLPWSCSHDGTSAASAATRCTGPLVGGRGAAPAAPTAAGAGANGHGPLPATARAVEALAGRLRPRPSRPSARFGWVGAQPGRAGLPELNRRRALRSLAGNTSAYRAANVAGWSMPSSRASAYSALVTDLRLLRRGRLLIRRFPGFCLLAGAPARAQASEATDTGADTDFAAGMGVTVVAVAVAGTAA